MRVRVRVGSFTYRWTGRVYLCRAKSWDLWSMLQALMPAMT